MKDTIENNQSYGIWMGKELKEMEKEELLNVIQEIGKYYEGQIKELQNERSPWW